MSYCTSCGALIPDDQGSSCSMCYGDIHYGHDGYYEEWARQQQENEDAEREAEDKWYEDQDIENR